MLIDLTHDFYIARFATKQDYESIMFNGPWVINDHYLHIRRWEPNFVAKLAKIESLLVWVRFPILPVEYFNEHWLKRAGNRIGRTVKVDRTTLMAARGKFARACVEVDLTKPLKSGYMMRGRRWLVQYEGLHNLCFICGRFGHTMNICPTANPQNPSHNTASPSSSFPPQPMEKNPDGPACMFEKGSTADFDDWMTAVKPRRRQGRVNFGRGGGHQPEAVTKTANGPTRKQANNQAAGITDRHKGSRFDALNDLNEEMDYDGSDTARATPTPNPSKESSGPSEAGVRHGLGHSDGREKMKGKEKMNTFSTAASNESILKDLRPLGQDQSSTFTPQPNKPVHSRIGPAQPMSDITNVMNRAQSHIEV